MATPLVIERARECNIGDQLSANVKCSAAIAIAKADLAEITDRMLSRRGVLRSKYHLGFSNGAV
jgi:hypothetical protein